MLFSKSGNFYHYAANSIAIGEKVPVESLIQNKVSEEFIALASLNKNYIDKNIIFFTKKGIMKKSSLSEYNTKRSGGAKAIELQENDEICSVIFTSEAKVGILTQQGQFLICETKDVRPISRVAKGVKSIKLNENDIVVSAKVIPINTKEIASITKMGYGKRTSFNEFSLGTRYTKGTKLHKLKYEEDSIKDFIPICDEQQLIITSNSSQIKLILTDIALVGKGAQGVKVINLKNEKDFIVRISNA